MKLDPVARGIPAAETDSATSEKGKDQRKSIYHFFSSKLEKITSNTDEEESTDSAASEAVKELG